MYKLDGPRTAISAALLAGTGYAVLVGNETVLPTLAVALLLALQFAPPLRRAGAPPRLRERPADAAIIGFTGLFGALSLLVSLFLPSVASALHVTGWYDGDFVRVSVNDAHEFAYAACLLLLLRAALGGVHRIRARRGRTA